MPIRTVDVSEADKASAKLFFDLLFELYGFSSKVRVLDAFARNGQLTVANYCKFLASDSVIKRAWLNCWELNPEHKEALLKFTDNVEIGDSYALLEKTIREVVKYDLLVIDTPQGLHKDSYGEVHAEHFDFFKGSLPLVGRGAVIVLYVNKSPYNKNEAGEHGYDSYQEYDFEKWMAARRSFYGASEITEERALHAYANLLGRDFKIAEVVEVPCYSDVPGKDSYSYRLGLSIVRK